MGHPGKEHTMSEYATLIFTIILIAVISAQAIVWGTEAQDRFDEIDARLDTLIEQTGDSR